jgi:DNA-directed RNA polymerase specialized sigma24 family protein
VYQNLPSLPPDPTPEERELLFEWDTTDIYQTVPGLMDKFIIAMVFELGYSQTSVAWILQVSDGYISQRIGRLKNRLKKAYNLSDTKTRDNYESTQ